MNKKICVIAAALASSLLLSACGSKAYLKDIKAEKYVTLGAYVGLKATADKPEVTQEMVDSYIAQMLASKTEKIPVTDRPVQEGDVANIDFAGYKDGVAFEGGTGAGFDLTIGSGQFIDGFESGLIGAKVGEKRSLNLTFPDPYSNPDLAGQPVVFEVTVNSISESRTPELTDELVQQLGSEGYNVGGAKTAAELTKWVKTTFEEAAQSSYDTEIEDSLADQLLESSSFQTPPEEMVKRLAANIEQNANARAASANMTLAQYMQAYQGMDETAYRAFFDEEALKAAKIFIMYQAIADKEGLAPTKEEIAEKTSELMKRYGYANEAEMKQKGADMEAIAEDVMRQNVVDFLKENGSIEATKE